MPDVDGMKCPKCSTPMIHTKPQPRSIQDHFYANCPGCGYEQTPETVREMAQKIVDEAKAKRQAKKFGK